MKKQFVLLTAIFALLIGNVFSQTVYVTKTGKKYHSENCSYLKSKISISLSDALAKGYTACSKCNPPTSATQSQPQQNTSQNQPQDNTSPTNNNSTQSTSVQCSATTKAGNRCSRMTKSPNGKCWQHGGN